MMDEQNTRSADNQGNLGGATGGATGLVMIGGAAAPGMINPAFDKSGPLEDYGIKLRNLPSIGRIVHYVLANFDAEAINRRRDHARQKLHVHKTNQDGSQIHFGSVVQEGEVFPAMVTRVHDDGSVNLVIHADGNDPYWKEHVPQQVMELGAEYVGGTWHWPPRA